MKDLKKYTFKTLAVFLSILMIVYLVPTFVFAEWIDGLSSGTSGENDEPAGRASDTYEMTERREENVKHFHCPDGTNIAVQYDMPVHYLDNGEWKDIDNTLAASGNDYSTSNARIKFAKKITGNESLFTLHDGNRKIVMSLDGARKKTAGKVTSLEKETDATETKLQKLMRLDKLSSKITYENILDGTDLEYIVFSSNVKENIIVKKKLPSYLYTFTISLNNLTAAVRGDGSVRIYDPTDDETVYVIPRGYMVDADGARSDAVSYSVSDLGNGKYKFTVTADADWINSDGRAFPVEIDPSLNADSADCVDVDFSSDSPNTSCDTDLRLFIGGPWHAAWKTNTLPELPEYAYITNVKFALYCQYTGNNCIGIYKITSDWDGSLNWSRLTDSSEGVPDTDPLDYNMFDEDTESGHHSWDITDLARSWYDGSEENHGVFLQDVEEFESLDYTIFFSSNNPDVTLHPQLIVTYRDQLGVEDYWSFISQKAGSAGVGSLNLANGNLVFSIGTLTSTDSLMPFTPTLIYNSMLTKWYYTRHSREVPYNYATVAGGFKTNINQCIVPRTYINENQATETFYVYTDADGTEHAFFRSTKSDESNIYYDEDGLKLKLTVYESEYTITDPDFNVYTFTRDENNTSYTYAGGYLTQITDVNGNTVAFDCNSYGRPTAVKLKPNGASSYTTQLEIYYRTGGVISYILNPATQQAVHLFYSADYNTEIAAATRYLRKIVVAHQKDGNTSAANWINFRNNDYDPHIEIDAVYYYDYDSVGHLRSITDDLNEVNMYYTYDSAGRVISVSEWGRNSDEWQEGQTVNITYGTGYTEVETSGEDDDITTEDDNIITRYVFDNEGRCVSCYFTDKDGKMLYGATSGSYEEDNEKAKNSIKQSASVSDIATNYLVNPGFEVNGVASLYGWSRTGAVEIAGDHTSYNRNAYDKDYAVNMSVSSGGSASIYQSVYLKAGTYTLSGDIYRKTHSDVDVLLKVKSPNGDVVTEKFHFSRVYDYPESAEAALTFKVPSDGTYTVSLVLNGKSTTAAGSTVSVRHMTLARSIGFSAFSRVENGSFERSSSSTIDSWTVPSGVTASAEYAGDALLLGNSLKLVADNVLNSNCVEQTVYRASDSDISAYLSESYPISPKQYRVSGRGMADHVMGGADSIFGIQVTIKYVSQTAGGISHTSRTYTVPFNKYTGGWQFASDIVSTEKNRFVEEIKIGCVYSRQHGTAYFDDISLCFVGDDDNVSQAAFAENGKPSIVKTGNSIVWYEYNSNDMIEWKISRHDAYKYIYSSDKSSRVEAIWHYRFSGDALAEYYGFDIETSAEPNNETQYVYNDYGQPIAIYVWDSGSRTERYMSYEAGDTRIVGALKSETDTAGVTHYYFYDENTGDLLAAGDSSGRGMTYTYDVMGRMTQAMPAELTVDGSGEAAYSAVGNSANAGYTYDTFGRLSGVSTRTTDYTFVYDYFGNSESIMIGDEELASYTYAPYNGKLETLTYGNGVSVKYEYDRLDRIAKVCYNTGEGTAFSDAYLYTYDSNGNINKITDLISDKITVFRYDSRGKLCEYYVNDSDSELKQSALYLSYDDEGRLKTQVYTRDYKYEAGAASTVVLNTDFSYDLTEGTLSRYIVEGDGYSRDICYSYDGFGRTSSVTRSLTEFDGTGSIGQNIAYGYIQTSDPDDGTITYNRIGSVTNEYTVTADDETTTVASETFTYTYDASGNITEIKNNGSTLFRYHYDLLDQLTREDNAQSVRTYVYEYDNAGNIKSKKTYGYTTAATVSTTLYSTQTYGYGSGISGDILTSLNGSSITYDGTLSPLNYVLSGDDCALTWTQGRRLSHIISDDGSREYSYTYNADGIRTSKTVNGVEHIYHLSGTRILDEEWVSGSTRNLLIYIYDASGQPIGINYLKCVGNTVTKEAYLLGTNIQGDITCIYDTAGNRVVTYTYDAWGKILSVTGTAANTIGRYNPLRYRGYYYDNETGFYYLNSRYYDPAVGRFLNVDSDLYNNILGYNLYIYCNNNPVYYVDPYGNDASSAAEVFKWWIEQFPILSGADGPLPFGELVFIIGAIVLGIPAIVQLIGSITTKQKNQNPTDNQPGETVKPDERPTDDKGRPIVRPGEMPTEREGYHAPKGKPRKGKTRGGKTGWIDSHGNIWVPVPTGSGEDHGGGHWDVERGDGRGYINVYPGGHVRAGSGRIPIFKQ